MPRLKMVEPPVAAADEVTLVQEPDRSTYRVLQREEKSSGRWWKELEPLPAPYGSLPPDADQLGEAYGEGEYLLIDTATRYSFQHVYMVRVVAEKLWRLAEDDE